MNKFLRRMTTIFVVAPTCIAITLYNTYAMAVLFNLFTLGCLTEYLYWSLDKNLPKVLANVLMIAGCMFDCTCRILGVYVYDLSVNESIMLYLLAGSMAAMNPYEKFIIILGMMWIIPACMISIIYGMNDPYMVIVLLTMMWNVDGGAYMVGSLIGRTPLMPSVSPKKTVEGVGGGIIFSMTMSYIMSQYYTTISLTHLLTLTVICGITGQIGDLIESFYKRSLNLKDSSNLMGQHGGLLDRCDSIFVAVPVSFLYLSILGDH